MRNMGIEFQYLGFWRAARSFLAPSRVLSHSQPTVESLGRAEHAEGAHTEMERPASALI